MRIQFNTGRGYTLNGQRIIAVTQYDSLGNRVVRFNDIDRGGLRIDPGCKNRSLRIRAEGVRYVQL